MAHAIKRDDLTTDTPWGRESTGSHRRLPPCARVPPSVHPHKHTHSQMTQMNKYNRIQLLKHSSRLIANWRHEKVSAWLERKASVDLEGLRLVIFHNKYLFKTNSLVRRGPFIKIIDLAWIKKICYPFNKYNLLKIYFSHTKKDPSFYKCFCISSSVKTWCQKFSSI